MLSKGDSFNRYLPSKNKEEYLSAIREFTQMTIQNPSFFNKAPEEQKEVAFTILQEHKDEIKGLQNKK